MTNPSDRLLPSSCVDVHCLAGIAPEVSQFLRLFSGETRLRMLLYIYERERTSSELKESLNISQGIVVRILSEFRYSGVVDSFRKGRATYYKIVDGRVHHQVALLHHIFCAE